MRTHLFLPAIMLAATATAQPQPGSQRAIHYTEFDLSNGLHVILHRDNSTPIVCVSVMYHVGSKNERPDRRGFAHFFEHLLFEGSAHIERGEFSRLVEEAGGVLNANTTGDRTYYYEVLPSNHLELGLWLESERMLHARVDRTGIDTQREVVKEERRQRYENQPYGSILIEVLKRAYTVHPYQWPTIGFMEDLDAADERDYQEFYRTWYVPDNAVLVVAGDIDEAAARKLVEKYFGDIPRGGLKRPALPVEPALPGEVRDTVYDRVQLPAVVHAYRIPALGSKDYYAVDLVNRILSGGNSARLNTVLKDRQRLAIATGAFTLPFEDPGLAILFAISNMGVEAGVLDEGIEQVVHDLHRHGITAEELEKLKAQLETEYLSENSRVAGVANNLANAYMLLGSTELVNTELERYLALTPADIQRAAQVYFAPWNRVVLYYLPDPHNEP
jgi:predicted Zn-dependent peptidase